MLAQRGGDLAPKAPAARKAEGVAAPAPAREPKAAPPKAARRRLRFHEKHALEQLPERIAALRTTIEDLHRRLDDPTFYARDRRAFDQASSALAAAEDELSAAEEKWLELEILREEVEGR
jgi:ATP-binding cassette subfamily F protein uup